MTSVKFWNFEPHSSPLYTFSRNLSYWAPLLNPSLQDFLPPFEYRRHKWKLPFLLPSWIFFLFLPFSFRFRSRARSSFHRLVAKVLKAPPTPHGWEPRPTCQLFITLLCRIGTFNTVIFATVRPAYTGRYFLHRKFNKPSYLS